LTAAWPVQVIVNPSNVAQRYALWSNGRVDAIGGAAVTGITAPGVTFYDRLDQPVAMAIWITNWTTGQGYVLDFQGGYQPLNGATEITSSAGVNNNGLPYVSSRLYIDWTWDPNGTGRGYVLDIWGQLWPFGGAVNPPRTGRRFATPVARKLEATWSAGAATKVITLDYFGGLHADFGANVSGANGPYWPGWDAARDFAVSDWTASPQKGYVLDLYGGANPFGGAPATVGGPYQVGADQARTLNIINPSNPLELFQVWNNGQQFDYVSSTPPTIVCGNGVSEVQTVTITGTPTAGTFTLTFGGNTTAATAFNATASTVQTNLRALASIGGTNVTVTGGPGPGTPYVVTFGGTLAQTNVAQMTASSSFTGGTSPTTTVTTTVDGVTASPSNTVTTTTRPTLSWSYTDAQSDSQAVWQVYLFTQTYVTAHTGIDTNPAAFASGALAYGTDTNPTTRGVVADIDLPNASYKYYVRSSDSSGLWSAWASRQWTQNVTMPSTPTSLTATPDQTNFLVTLSVNATTGGTSTAIRFEYSDDGGTTWLAVRGGEAVNLQSTTTIIDYDPPLGVTRTYRAYAFGSSPRIASTLSTTATALINKKTFVLTCTDNNTLGGEVNVVDKPAWTRPVKAGVFEGIGARFPTVVSDGVPKARKISLKIDTNSRAEWDLVRQVIEANSTIVLRDPFGDVAYCRVVGDWSREQMRRAPSATETTSLRHAHQTVVPLVEIAPPVVTSALSTVPPGPGSS
jgi:hypothetical protein